MTGFQYSQLKQVPFGENSPLVIPAPYFLIRLSDVQMLVYASELPSNLPL
jgi:hypothetical protein